ncbi:SIMPL domain-containing protein [Uruburuella testudinis]|uniref:SIMPL domain-containing protein n=1 Tax=Uruburuella testudinis TaxID=1282863 RepID=A0ABY4DPS7_9NEIS|nr:SIMPL domain-containing protein [Uruburuella testudinis]UOO81040.1 SIMPL domain-containing protein [Uruburuella testudinis]
MLKKTLLLAALAATAAFPVAAEPLNYNIVQFAESANAEVPRDTMIIRLTVNEEGRDRAVVNRAFVRKYNTLTQRIEANRAFKSELLGRNAYPRYEYKNGKRTQIGWQETAQIKVESKDFTALNRLIAEAQNEANLQNTSFSVSKQKREEVIDEVSKAALARFQSRAETLARTLGFRGYKIVSLDLGQIGNQEVMSAYADAAAPMALRAMKAGSAGEIAETPNPGTEQISITVNGTIQL